MSKEEDKLKADQEWIKETKKALKKCDDELELYDWGYLSHHPNFPEEWKR